MRAAIIGLGAIAPNHVNAIRHNGGDIVAICDVVPEKITAFKEKFSLDAKGYTDYKEMLDEVRPDVIHICTPHYLHCEMICEGLKRDINVLTEKPLAISYEQLDTIREAVKHSRAQVGVSQQNRYNKSIKYAESLYKNDPVTSAVGILAWCRNAAYYNSGAWRGKWDTEGGGVAINQAIHTLDLLQHFCGMPKSVIGHVSNDLLKDVIEVEESCFGIFKVNDDTRFSLMASNAMNVSFPVVIMLSNKKDTVVISGDNAVIVNGSAVDITDNDVTTGKSEWGVGHVKLIGDFYAHVERGEKFPLDTAEAEKVIKLILAMYESHGNETEIK